MCYNFFNFLGAMALDQKNIYQDLLIPKNLSFDEESLFWRLRLGEGIPNRKWHKPLDRQKTWHEIKLSLDKKLQAGRANEIFQKVYPKQNIFFAWLKQLFKNIKIAFLLTE
jgi:hypothetical protein